MNVYQHAVITNKHLYISPVRDLTSLSEGIHFDKVERDSRISGTAQVDQDGILMMTIPYENGWHAFVDEKEVEIHKVNYGFSGIYLEKGSLSRVCGRCNLQYRLPGFHDSYLGYWSFESEKKELNCRKKWDMITA